MCTLSFLSLSSCRLFIFPSTFTLAFHSLSLSLERPTSLVLYPFLIALIAKSTHFRNDDWSAHPRAPSSSIWSTEVQPFPFPFSARLPRCRSGKESSATNRRAPVFFAGFSLCTVMEGPWKRRSILRDLDRGIVVSVDSSSSTANSSTTTVNAFLSFFLSVSLSLFLVLYRGFRGSGIVKDKFLRIMEIERYHRHDGFSSVDY